MSVIIQVDAAKVMVCTLEWPCMCVVQRPVLQDELFEMQELMEVR
jgi:hypothetical protein